MAGILSDKGFSRAYKMTEIAQAVNVVVEQEIFFKLFYIVLHRLLYEKCT